MRVPTGVLGASGEGDDQMFFTVPEKRVHCQVEEMQPGMGHF